VWNISWPAIIVRARLVTIGKVYEEAAADLGAARFSAMWRVLLPLLMPAIFASAVLTFASVIDDFVLVEQLSGPGSQTMSVLIYSQAHGGNNGPALNALATLMLVFSLVVAGLGYVAYRLMTRGERGNTAEALTSIAGM
jgi:spermidine/putrescine transport system permease protein